MKSIIITGATSYLAVPLINRLLEKEYFIYAVVRPGSPNVKRLPKHENINIIEMDMKNLGSLTDIYLKNICAVYHFMWEGVRGALRDDVSLQAKSRAATEEILKASIKMKVPYFIGIGSQAEYGLTTGKITEQTALNPFTEYGRNKAKAYSYGMELCGSCQTKFVWARIFSAYGKNEDGNTLLMHCISKMKNNEEIKLSACEHMWDYTYADDVAEALCMLFEKQVESGAYNISAGQARKLKEYILQLKSIMQSESVLHFGSPMKSKGVQAEMDPDVTKLMTATGWKPKVDFESGIKKVIDISL